MAIFGYAFGSVAFQAPILVLRCDGSSGLGRD